MKKILVIDNHDSFVYNLVEYLREIDKTSITVVQNEGISEINPLAFDGILLSPGAGLPSDYPETSQLIEEYCHKLSFLGICLGHQAIAQHFGATLKRHTRPKHGHSSTLNILIPEDILFSGIDCNPTIGRYHSWCIDSKHIGEELEVLGVDEDKNIMAIRHKKLPIWGLQFHPESIITTHGREMIRNWVDQL